MDLQLFVDDAPFAVALLDSNMRYVAASQRWRAEHKLGNSAIGLAAWLGGSDAEAQMRDGFRRALKGERIILPVERLALPGGGARWTRTEMRPWRRQQDEIAGVVVCVEDVSPDVHPRLIDAAPREISLLDREGNIDVEKIRAQLRRAEENDRGKNRFLGALAHELRTPLATIVLTVETLLAEAPTDQFRAALDRVIRQGRRLSRLVSELAGVSSLCEGETDLRKAPVDLVALLTQAVEMVRERIDEKGCTLHMRLPDDPLPIMGDAALLVQAFRTLLENAAKFSSPGGRITLDVQRRGTDAVVTVRDDGAGITADLLPLIFEPFERKAPPGRKGEGLGVALALARAWMRLHGGEMRAESGGKDKGSLFEARLPLTRA